MMALSTIKSKHPNRTADVVANRSWSALWRKGLNKTKTAMGLRRVSMSNEFGCK
jgi:hypothetical protein